jgi:hypothetical protein
VPRACTPIARASTGWYSGCTQLRRAQKSITIRSNKAYALLNVLMGNGRSQVQVIEEALDRVSNAVEPDTLAARMARLNAILDRIDPSDIPSMAEFDAMTYDEYGLPR